MSLSNVYTKSAWDNCYRTVEPGRDTLNTQNVNSAAEPGRETLNKHSSKHAVNPTCVHITRVYIAVAEQQQQHTHGWPKAKRESTPTAAVVPDMGLLAGQRS